MGDRQQVRMLDDIDRLIARLEHHLAEQLTARITKRVAGKTRACISCLKIPNDGAIICARCRQRKRFPRAVLALAGRADEAIRHGISLENSTGEPGCRAE